jgi:hypothetical protein
MNAVLTSGDAVFCIWLNVGAIREQGRVHEEKLLQSNAVPFSHLGTRVVVGIVVCFGPEAAV